MLRDVNMSDISNGKRYSKEDLVRISCNDCKDCSACCRDMGTSIVLDPYDVYQLTKGIEGDMEALLQGKLELNVVEGVILPNIVMEKKTNACGFLSESGRCTIHDFRPGFCRLFPLGRIYEGGGFSYFHQVKECPYPNKSKIKIKKWLDIPELGQYEKFVLSWHDLLRDIRTLLKDSGEEEQKSFNMAVLEMFFIKPYDINQPFYPQYYQRHQLIRNAISIGLEG